MNMKYIIKSHRLCKSEFMFLWVFCLLFYVFAEVVLTIDIVECSECKASVWLCLLKYALGFILLSVSREPDFTQITAGRTSRTTEQISNISATLKTHSVQTCRLLKITLHTNSPELRQQTDGVIPCVIKTNFWLHNLAYKNFENLFEIFPAVFWNSLQGKSSLSIQGDRFCWKLVWIHHPVVENKEATLETKKKKKTLWHEWSTLDRPTCRMLI